MLLVKNFQTLPIYFFCLAGLVGCGSIPQASMNNLNLSFGSNVVNIGEIKPESDSESSIYLQGKVTKQVPLVDWRVYQLQDSTGAIWVLTEETDWQLGDQLLIQGEIHYQSIPIANQEFGEIYVKVQKQLERTPAR